MSGIGRWGRDASASVADAGVLVPIVVALIIGNGLDAGTVLVCAGALYLVAGLYFRVPVPVQPIKAAAAIAIARDLPVETIAAAGVVLGFALVVLSVTGMTALISRLFTVPVVRGLQLGVGLILLRTAADLAGSSGGLVAMGAAAAIAAVLTLAARRHEPIPVALGIVAVAIALGAWSAGTWPSLDLMLWQPQPLAGAWDLTTLGSAAVLLVVPQIPLTFGNAVVAVVDLEHRYFPGEARKVTPRRIALSCGIGNLVTGALGGMPMCHGSGGLTAHYRAGARTYRMNVFIGVILLMSGLFFAPVLVAVMVLIPAAILGGFLAFTGVYHSSLAVSLRGFDLVVAGAMGAVGLVTMNLAIALAVGLLLFWPARAVRRAAPAAARS